jgi:hypothetical protein
VRQRNWPPTDVATPLCLVTLLSHRAKTSSPLPFHLLATLHPIASSFKKY